MNLVTHAVILLCGIYISDAGYGYGNPPPPQYDTQSDVQAPAYAPPYVKNPQSTKTGRTGYGTKTYSGAKTHTGTKTAYSGTKTYHSKTKSYSGTKTAYGEKQSWHSESGNAPTWEEFNHNANEPFKVRCVPECKNDGICVAPNQCHCRPDFKGTYCEVEAKPCLSYPPLPMNSLRKCSSDFCTITCFEGYKFAGLGTTATNMACNNGNWQPTIPLLASVPDCEPQCNPPCLNGGVCLAVDTCQCPSEYRGPQCQYSTSVCDIRKLAFNGGYKCFGDGESFTCTLTCPDGVSFSSPAAESYVCTYATGQFQPQPIPHCVYNNEIIPGHHHDQLQPEFLSYTSSESKVTEKIHESSFDQQNSGFEQQNGGFEQQNGGFEQQNGGFEQQNGGFEQQNGGFEQQNGGFEQQNGGFEQQNGGFEQQNGGFEQQSGGFEQQSGYETGFSQKPMKIVVQDYSPKGGVCLTWAGTHYKTFDGKIYSFQSPCQHILMRERREHKYTVAIQQPECKRHAYCPSELTIYLEDKPYVLSVGEDGAVIFRNTKRLIPIPAALTGIRVSMPSDYVLVNLDGAGVTIKWDTNDLVLIEGTVQLWNNTEGLCGTLNSNPADDFLTKDDTIAPTQSVFEASWKMNKIGDVCSEKPTESSACSLGGQESKQAKMFCSTIFSKDKFRKCSKVMDVTQLLDTCQWDYCACAASQSAEECACATVSVYAKECLRNGVEDMKTWRDADTCPMKCPEGKIYKACGPDSQPSCAFPTVTAVDESTCVEGCFCPEGMLLEAGKCIPKSECPCRLRNKVFKTGTVVPKGCNTCACQAGEWTCTQAPCGARCSAMGDPHYTTFDGSRYDFMGHCTYEMMRADNVTVEVENVACSGAITEAMNLTPYKGAGKPSCTRAISVKYNQDSIHLKQGGFILVNGQEVAALPVAAGGVRIRTASSLFLMVQLPNKVDIWWDGNTRVYIDVPPEFHEKTKGLCGTFNLNQKDDFLTPEGDVEQSAYAFANKWKTREFCEDVDVVEPEHPCKANVENKEAAEKYCSRLKSKLFEECHWFVDVEPYYLDCVYDMCACAGGDVSHCLCPVLGDYAMECARNGVNVQWRYNVKECEPTCGLGQEYTVCADSCLRTCADVALEGSGECKPVCVEGCACPAGQVLDENNQCIPIGMCPCYYKGVKFAAGYKECRPGKRERDLCTCVGARWECAPATNNDIKEYPAADNLRNGCIAALHMEFTTCELAEPLTCKNMHLPQSTTTAECRPGCQCKKGYVLDTASKKCVLATECPCHHGGTSYADGATMREECNKCECKNGNWSCTTKQCAGVCTAWGDSHIITYDGSDYDFEGVCTYLLAKGVLDSKDGFDVEIQNVPCGSTGATCSKSVTLKVGSGSNEETVTLSKDAPLPDTTKLKGIKLRIVGVFVYLDVPRLGMSLQWDRGMRVYVKVDSMWQGRLKGLCGNFNGDLRDDYQTPGGGIPESSALIFVDSWKLKSTCPKAQPVLDHCQQKPERREYATTTCGALKRYPFTLCHTEVPVGPWVERCSRDACACDAGDDCACVCTALAAYAQLCAARGVSFKWRTQHMCPMQCDEECSNYDDCLSSCPLETCDNTLDYAEIKAVCEQDTCVEGCKPKQSCPEGSVYSNSSFTECVPRSTCRRVCMTLPDGKEVLEGEITQEDACHTCRCSKRDIVCTGQPCSTALPSIPTEPSTEKPFSDESLKCVPGWTPWLNRARPQTLPNGDSVDKEPLPKPKELQIGSPMCQPEMMSEIECRTTVNHKTAKETGLNAECSLERGLVCKESGNVCPDFEIRVHCECEEERGEIPKSILPIPEPVPSPEPEPFQCLNADHPNYPHPTNCSMFYECTPDPDSTKKHAVLKTCGEGLMYNPKLMVCDWPESVITVRPECGITTIVPSTATFAPMTTTSKCAPGLRYSDCAFPCDKMCHHFRSTMLEKGRCKGLEKCVEGCVALTCESGRMWRDQHSCVPLKDCTCYSDGNIVKPNGVARNGCEVCQCLENDLHCDNSACRTTPLAPPEEVTQPSTVATTAAPLIVKNTATPPPECSPEGYKNLLWENDEPLPSTAFTASSVANDLFAPQFAELNAHPIDISAGSWSPKVEDQNQYIQVTLPRREPIYGVIMQGSPLFDQYVTSYEVMYGDDGHAFSLVEDGHGKPKVFRGPLDHDTPLKQMIEPPIEAKVLRIRPLTWHDSIAVRFELIGCQEPSTTTTEPAVTTPEVPCTEPLGLGAELPVESIEVSSNNDLRRRLALRSDDGWKPAYSTPGEWIMFDFTSPRNITGIKTKGGTTGWVTVYNILYTSDLSTFNPVVDNTGAIKNFPANFNKDSVVFNEFKPPIHARYLKVLPLKWKDAIEMRVEPIGCFEPYPVTESIPEDITIELAPCSLCPGVHSLAACNCTVPGLNHYDGENCVSRDQCPCVLGFFTYAVGSSFRGANCDECVCKLGGITDCKPLKECVCPSNLVPKLSVASCECTCMPCAEGTKICPTSKVCLPLEKWCDGLQDCPDDEKDCKTKEQISMRTTEEPVVSSFASTVGAVPTTTVAPPTTTPKPQACPKVECPPGYFVRYVSSASSYSRASAELPPPRPRNSYSRYTKGGAKGGSSYGTKTYKGWASKGGTKGGYTPAPIPQTTRQPTANKPANTTQECAQFKCIPNLPPPFKPGSTPPPPDCSSPICPPNYTLKLDTVPLEPNQCPQYICVPPPERYAYCNMTGRTLNTFDNAEYKFDVCFHILARDARFNAWSVLVRKICSIDGCMNHLIVHQDEDIITVKPSLIIQYNQYEYTIEQTSKICFQKNNFDVHRIGDGLLIKSRRYDFGVIYTTDGNVKVAVNTKYKNAVEGLCGFFDGSPSNDRRKSDGALAASIDEFAHSWAKPGLRPDACVIKIIPPEKQLRAWALCDVITKEPLNQCGKVVDLDKWRSMCLEKICECTGMVVNGTKRTEEECRCLFLDTLVAQCLAADKNVDLSDWRMQMDCPAECPAPLVHYDCYRRRCEPACSSIGDTRRTCPVEDGQCFPGCYCPDGKLRKGDTCVTPPDCLDCACTGVGTPAKYVSFEGDDIPYLGNCTYLASRDRNETGHRYQVYASNGPCEDNSIASCTKSVHLIYEKNIVQVTRDHTNKKLITTVNKVPVYNFPLSNDWITVSQVNGQDISMLLPNEHVEVKVLQARMELSVKVPSYLYANLTEGLCGVCAGYLDALITSNGTVALDFEEYGASWQAPPEVLEVLEIPPQEQCGDIPPPPDCKTLPPEHNPCYNLKNADRFGACHALLDPQSYIDTCEEELCALGSTDVCAILERYAAECRRQGVCLSWREGLCPYPCELPTVYEPCMQCEETCENYEKNRQTQSCYAETPVEGCFCPEGKVRVNNTCIEPKQCFPCDIEKKHYVGDEWQEDACKSCTCSKSPGENKAQVSCTVQSCRSPPCAPDEDLLAHPPPPGVCCPEYSCVPIPRQTHCEEPKAMDCGFGQVRKLKTNSDGCSQYTCECKPASECEHIPSANEVDILEPGMERHIDESGCCPRALMLCKPETCPAPPVCPQYHKLVTDTTAGKCCPTYKCEAPKDKCLVSLEWEATPKGGEKLKEKRQIVLKDIEATWIDGPCRMCVCERSPLGPVARCSTTECPPIVATDQFVLEPKPEPFQCCPIPLYVACRDGDNIYKVDETWKSSDNVCESYQCLRTDDGKLEKVTTVQTCHTDCDAGSKYFPAEAGSGKCCGKCKPVVCVCEGREHAIGEHWASPDFCTTYTCVDANGTIQVEMTTETCPEVPIKIQKQFVLNETVVPGKCCKSREPVACRVGNDIYQEGQSWRTDDTCKNMSCGRDASGRLALKESSQSCVRDCKRGWRYQRPAAGACCGDCVQDACVVDDDLKEPGTTWYSADNCTTYTCERDGDIVQVSMSRQKCPDISLCAPEDVVNETCCQVCKEKPAALSTCVPTVRALPAGVVRLQLRGRGLCANALPVPDFKECQGTCDSGTRFNNMTGNHDSKCECCQTVQYSHVLVKLSCEDGGSTVHQVASPQECACRACSGPQPWPGPTWPTPTEADEIPDIYQRFDNSQARRKH